MDCPKKIKLPSELILELTNCLHYNFRWSGTRISLFFDHFLAKNQRKIRRNKIKQLFDEIREQEKVMAAQEKVVADVKKLLEYATARLGEANARLKDLKQRHKTPLESEKPVLTPQMVPSSETPSPEPVSSPSTDPPPILEKEDESEPKAKKPKE